MTRYDKVGLLVIKGNQLLLCRKKHSTSLLILPGGCREPGESSIETLRREIREELGDVGIDNVEQIGTYSDQAAGSDGDAAKMVQIELYRGNLAGEPAAHSEIKELVWFGEKDLRSELAPSIRNKILPDLLGRGILRWQS